MSKFHKTFKNHFVLNEKYNVCRCLFSALYVSMEYVGFKQGHLLFSYGLRGEQSILDVSGGDIRDKRVTIKNKDNETFTVNGWQKE